MNALKVLPGNEIALAELEKRLAERKAEFEAECEAIKAAQAALIDPSEKVNVTKSKPTKAGNVGVLISGFGIPQFFYPTHLMLLIGEGEGSERVRAKLRAQVEQMRGELTWGTKK